MYEVTREGSYFEVDLESPRDSCLVIVHSDFLDFMIESVNFHGMVCH